jgi:hypothetical protein
MPAGWTISTLLVTLFKTQIFENMTALFAFKLMNGHVYDPPDFPKYNLMANILITFTHV